MNEVFNELKQAMDMCYSVTINLQGEEGMYGVTGIVENITDGVDAFRFYEPGVALHTYSLNDVLYVDSLPWVIDGLDSIKLYVDDNRPVPEGYVLAKSVSEAKTIIDLAKKQNIGIVEIDLDHDLGDYRIFGGDAINLVNFLLNYDIFVSTRIHTANPEGAKNMRSKLDMLKEQAQQKGVSITYDIYKV